MSDQKHEFNPDWGSNPAGTIRELMRLKGMDQRAVASAMAWQAGGGAANHDRCDLTLSFLLHGPNDPNMILDDQTAVLLAAVLGGSKQFWITRYQHWREHLSKSSISVDNGTSDEAKHSQPEDRLVVALSRFQEGMVNHDWAIIPNEDKNGPRWDIIDAFKDNDGDYDESVIAHDPDLATAINKAMDTIGQ